MGIKGFSSWLRTKFPVAFTQVKAPCTFDEVYIDLNSYLYSSAARAATSQQVLRHLEAKIMHTLKSIRARRRVFISIDGVAPAAKLDIQRSRRVEKAMDSAKNNMFDAQNFTPGCLFMGQVEATLKKVCEKYAEKRPDYFEFVISGASVKEEGEIKIAQELAYQHRVHGGKGFVERALITLDSDAFLQAFVNDIPSLFVLNTSELQKGLIQMFSGEMMRDKVREILPDHTSSTQIQLDFALMSIFSGNDCLSSVPFGNVTYLWPSYIEYVNERKSEALPLVDKETLLFNIEGIVAFAKFLQDTKLTANTKKLYEMYCHGLKKPLTDEAIVDYLCAAQWSYSRLLGRPVAQTLSIFASGVIPSMFHMGSLNVPKITRMFHEACNSAKDNRQDRKKIPGAAAIMMLDPTCENSVKYIAKPLREVFHAFHGETTTMDDHSAFKKLCQRISEIPKEEFNEEELAVTFSRLPMIYSKRKGEWRTYDPPAPTNTTTPKLVTGMMCCPSTARYYRKNVTEGVGLVINQ